MTTEHKLWTFITEELNWDGDPAELTPDYPLIDGHVVDSMGIVHMVSFIEDEFGIRVPDDEVLPDNFETIRRLTDFVEAKRAG
jgi:acyl carrier protein